MTFIEVALLAGAVVIDTVAVAAATGVAAARVRLVDALRMAVVFGAFHVAMPALGWALGTGVAPLVRAWDHWIAAALLAFVGLGMVRGALASAPAETNADVPAASPFRMRALLPLAVATSIDALAVGVSLPMMGAPLALTLATFGTLAFVVSGGTVLLARRAGGTLDPRAQRGLMLLGALVILGLAIKIPCDHLKHGL